MDSHSQQVRTRPDRPAVALIDPFTALDRTHRETMDHLRSLQAMLVTLEAQGIDGVARAIAGSVCSFFSGGARDHHVVEEQQVFPALLRSGNSELVQQVHRLQQDHGWIEEDWLELAPQLAAIADGNGGYDLEALKHGIEVFSKLYHEHISLEESLIYPEARRRLAIEEEAAGQRGKTGGQPHIG